MKRYAIALFLTLLLGCNSTDDSNPNCIQNPTGPLTANEQVLTGTWQLTAILAGQEVDLTDDGEDNPSNDIFAQFDDCGQDLSFTFRADRSYTYSQGTTATGCDSSESLSTNGTWQIIDQVLNLVANCTIQSTALTVSDAEDEFTLSYSNLIIQEVDGSQTITQVVYTYSKN